MNTFFCPRCGGEIPQGMRFCPHCMTALGEAERLETRPTGKNKKPAVMAMALVLCAAAGLGIFIALRDNAGNKPDSDGKDNSTHTFEIADESYNESVLTESSETQSSVAESIDDTSSFTEVSDSSENGIAESSAAETESIADTAISGLTKETLATISQAAAPATGSFISGQDIRTVKLTVTRYQLQWVRYFLAAIFREKRAALPRAATASGWKKAICLSYFTASIM
ncbi:MAG: hypothetical protein IJ737_01165 [Ruminococcus sp.]|nr:hypothetical protein [Ruminococcus sp.]